jgi:hypothetical protein
MTDWEMLKSKVKYRYREWLFQTMDKMAPAPDSDNELIAECAKYGMEVVWHEGLGMYLVGAEDRYYGIIGADWREEGMDMPEAIAELFVTGTFGVDP